MPSPLRLALAAAVAAPTVLAAGPAQATTRHFNQTYESGVLNPGSAELEPWTTFRHGRAHSFTAYDLRLEYEVGVVPNLQTSLYWNFSSVTQDDAGVRTTTTRLDSVSSEWKYKLSDPVADALGSAVYLEGTAGTDNAEVEAKLILDKRFGSLLVAANLVGDHEWNWAAPGDTKREAGFELDTAIGYFVTPSFIAGIEARSTSELEDADELESSVIYAGPSIGFSTESWWTTLSFTPQIAALKGASAGSHLDLDRQERMQARVIFGFHL